MLFHKLGAVMNEFRKLQTNTSIQTVQVFFAVAHKGEVSSAELRSLTGIPQTTISRALGDLGDWASRKKAVGLKLVSMERDPADNRHLICRLTPTGKLLAEHLRLKMGA